MPFTDPDAQDFLEDFQFYRTLAQTSLKLAQAYQERYYNEHRHDHEFQIGNWVLINLHSLQLLWNFHGRGRKLLPRFDGPYEIIQKISKVAYRLRLLASYHGHPVINIAHLESYREAEEITMNCHSLSSLRKNFDELEEFEVKQIIDSRYVKGPKGRRLKKYKVRWKGYEPKYDEWETLQYL